MVAGTAGDGVRARSADIPGPRRGLQGAAAPGGLLAAAGGRSPAGARSPRDGASRHSPNSGKAARGDRAARAGSPIVTADAAALAAGTTARGRPGRDRAEQAGR